MIEWVRDYRNQIRLFLLPYVVGTLALFVLPALATGVIAFTEYDAIDAPVWVGLGNFGRLFTSDYVRTGLTNTFFFILLAVPLRELGALGLALLLGRREREYGLFRAAVFVPTVIPEAAYALIWLWVFNPIYGPLNMALTWLRLPAPAWLAEPRTAQLALVIVSLFQIGEGFVVMLAGLQSIPPRLYEAARIDGATRWQQFFYVTLPLLLPWLLILTFRDLVMAWQNTFATSYIITYGGPYFATTFVPLLVYELAFDFFDFGLAAALLVMVYAVVGLLVVGIGRSADIGAALHDA